MGDYESHMTFKLPRVCNILGFRIRGTLGDIDPLNKVPFKRAKSRVQKGPFSGVSLRLPRIYEPITSDPGAR